MKCKIYASDEGFGPLIRQSAIVSELLKKIPNLKIDFQTSRHANDINWIISSNVNVIKKYNLISWARFENGSPNLEKIKKDFQPYLSHSKLFIDEEIKGEKYDFIISDIVPEAFLIAKNMGIPSFGVCHFTWDWFFSKLYPQVVDHKIIEYLQNNIMMADKLFFPPYTPKELVQNYHKHLMEVPLIVREKKPVQLNVEPKKNRKNILIIDSGSGVLSSYIQKSILQFTKLNDYHFFIAEKYSIKEENVTLIPSNALFTDYIAYMDLVIGRAGFNTISECIAYRTPMLLLSEENNPEMKENLIFIKKEELGSFISTERFCKNLVSFLPQFYENEYNQILSKLNNHNIKKNGAEVIAQNILDTITKQKRK